MTDILLSFAPVVVAAVLTYLGVHMRLHVPATATEAIKTRYKRAFIGLLVLSLILGGIQAWRSVQSRNRLAEFQDKLVATQDDLVKTQHGLAASQEKLAVSQEQARTLLNEVRRLSEHAIEIASTPTVLKRDVSPITFNVSDYPPNGDLLSCRVVVRTSVALDRPYLTFTFDRAPKNAFLENAPDPQKWKRIGDRTLEYWYGGSGGQTVFLPDRPAVFQLSSTTPFRLKSVSYRE